MVFFPFSTCRYCYLEIKLELAYRTRCNHFFHTKCASKFLDANDKGQCPCCHEDLYSTKYSPYFIAIRHRKLRLPTPTLTSIPEESPLIIVKEKEELQLNMFDKYLFRVKATYPPMLLKKWSGSRIYEQSFLFMENVFKELDKGQNECALDNAITAAWFFTYLQKVSPKMKGVAEDELKIIRRLIQVIEKFIGTDEDKKKEPEYATCV